MDPLFACWCCVAWYFASCSSIERCAFVAGSTPLPLDLEIVKQRLSKDYYHSLEAFRHDIELLVLNTVSFYGRESDMTARMQRLGHLLLEVMSYDEEPLSSDGNDEDEDEEESDGYHSDDDQ